MANFLCKSQTPWALLKPLSTDSTSNEHGLCSKKNSHSQKQAAGSRLDLALDSPWRLELRDGAYLFSSSSFLTRSFSSPIANTLYLQRRHKSMLVRQGGPHTAGTCSWQSFIAEGLNTLNSEHTETTPGFTLQTNPLLRPEDRESMGTHG